MDDKNAFIKDPVIELLYTWATDKRHLAKINSYFSPFYLFTF